MSCQCTLRSHDSLDSGVNAYLVEHKDDNVYDKFIAPKWLQDCIISVELKWHKNELVKLPA